MSGNTVHSSGGVCNLSPPPPPPPTENFGKGEVMSPKHGQKSKEIEQSMVLEYCPF